MLRTLDIALSTSSLPHLNLPPEGFLRVMGVFGTTSFELNYQVHPLDLDVRGDLIERHQLTIASLPNICSGDGTKLRLATTTAATWPIQTKTPACRA